MLPLARSVPLSPPLSLSVNAEYNSVSGYTSLSNAGHVGISNVESSFVLDDICVYDDIVTNGTPPAFTYISPPCTS